MLRGFSRRTWVLILPAVQLAVTSVAKFSLLGLKRSFCFWPATALAVFVFPGDGFVSGPASIIFL
jgi:hypothetical protein